MNILHSVTWMFITMRLIFASQDVPYLKKQEEESVLFVCESEETSSHPIGLYLKRKCVEPAGEVMFFSESGTAVRKPEDEERIQVQGDLSSNPVNVTISQLQLRDSGLYYCEFVYAGPTVDRFVTGKEEFLLFVEKMIQKDLQCNCPSYPPLLYAISVGVGLLLIILLGLAASYCGKPCKRAKPQTQVPIYEEMIGRQPANGKGPHSHLEPLYPEEAHSSEYMKPQTNHRQENHYVDPRDKQLAPETRATVMEDNQWE